MISGFQSSVCFVPFWMRGLLMCDTSTFAHYYFILILLYSCSVSYNCRKPNYSFCRISHKDIIYTLSIGTRSGTKILKNQIDRILKIQADHAPLNC